MSKDGLLPKRLGKIHPKFETPFFASCVTALLSLIIAGLFPINVLGELVSITTLFLFTVVCLGVLLLRYRHPEMKRPFKVPFVPLVPVLGILACVGQMGFFPKLAWLQLTAWLLIGLLVYFVYSAKHSKLRNL